MKELFIRIGITKIGGDAMHTKTMEGLIGARTNMNLVDTPMRVYKEARRKGDLGAMERAMGYANDFKGRAEEYKKVADEGMEKEAEEAKEKEKLEREEELEKKREEKREESREQISRLEHADTVELSEEGKAFVRENQDSDIDDVSLPATNPAVAKEPVLYTSAGTAKPAESKPTVSVSV